MTTMADGVLSLTAELARTQTPTAAAVDRVLTLQPAVDAIREAQSLLLGRLAREPRVDVTGIRAGRILWAALDAMGPAPAEPSLAPAA
jgi:hypothetical protein